MVTQTTAYTLRAGAPQPKTVCSIQANQTNLQVQRAAGFIIQTFKAEKLITESCDDKADLLCSNDMIGLGGNFLNASYTAQRFLDPVTGSLVFQARETRDRIIIDEDDVPGSGLL